MSLNIESPIENLKSIGPKRAEAFAKIGIRTIEDLIRFYPSKYLDRSTIMKSSTLKNYLAGGFTGEATLVGRVIKGEVIKYSGKQILKVLFRDGAGVYECVWFNSIHFLKDKFQRDEVYAVSCKPTLTKYNSLQLTHPDFDKLSNEESDQFIHTGKIIPFYKLPKELKDANMGDFGMRKLMMEVVLTYAAEVKETLPPELIKANQLMPLPVTLKNLHFPETKNTLTLALRRAKYEELFYLEILIAKRKDKINNEYPGFAFALDKELINKFLESLPFSLTEAQRSVLSDIRKDMERPHPMHRLLQGDVGTGKTIVAILAMLIAVSNEKQAALMVPTEILANQHFYNTVNLLKDFDVKVVLLTGGQTKTVRNQVLEDIESNEADIIIGTHAVFQDSVNFDKLGLIIIDEHHRFGVVQRSQLLGKAVNPDVLLMTATPIPRTLTMTLYGDLDLSIIDKPPANRKTIRTVVRGESSLPGIYKFIKDRVEEGHQAFIVNPLVEKSDKLDLVSAEELYDQLTKTIFKHLRVGLLHGKMSWQDKEQIMRDFAAHKYHILVTTTIIEVGVDIPDANVIVINNAYRFGISQLHQLRGRVGRASHQGFCILMTTDDMATPRHSFDYDFSLLPPQKADRVKSMIRLNAMVKYSSGFQLSEIDVKLRGPGDIFGTNQTGFPELRFAELPHDSAILAKAKQDAFAVIHDDKYLVLPGDKLIADQLAKSYVKEMEFAGIA